MPAPREAATLLFPYSCTHPSLPTSQWPLLRLQVLGMLQSITPTTSTHKVHCREASAWADPRLSGVWVKVRCAGLAPLALTALPSLHTRMQLTRPTQCSVTNTSHP